jgi:hypothetical protein
MFRVEKKVIDATCDGCGASLISPGTDNANFGFLKSAFGYGSPIDNCGNPDEFHLCEKCWTKALSAVGLQPS